MEFGDRLRELIEEEGISPALLADEIGVNRSGVSHILNGRNKPGYDFMHKLKERFPDWNYNWLFFGEGEKGRKTKTEKSPTSPKPQEKPQYSQQEHKPIQSSARERQASLFDNEEFTNPVQKKENHLATVQKKVTKTILIYNDGTFEIFSNKN